MKTTGFLSLILLLFALSCSDSLDMKDSTEKAEVMAREDWYWKMNLDFITKKEAISSKVKKSMIENGYKNYISPYAIESYHYLNGAISHRMASPSSSDEYLIVSQTSDSKFNFVIMKFSDEIVSYWQDDVFLAKFDLNKGRVSGREAYPGQCSELGALRKNEVFSECLVRNLENFCCDFTGCAAIVVSPTGVAAAATIACTGIF